MSRKLRARLGWWVGWLLVTAGVFLAFGPGWALIVAGLVVSLSFLLLYDVTEERAAGEPTASVPPAL